MTFLVTADGTVGGISKVHFTVGEALHQAKALLQRDFANVRIRDPQGHLYTADEFAVNYGLRGR